jgi:predicted ATPase
MIRRLKVRNFISLQETIVDLGPFNVFIGPNGSGKSALFKAMILLSKLVHQPIRGQREFEIADGVSLDRLVRAGNDNLPITFDVWFQGFTGDEPQYHLELRKLAVGWMVTQEKLQFPDFTFDSSKDMFEHGTELRGTITWKPPYPGTLSSLTSRYKRDSVANHQIAPFIRLADLVGNVWRYRVVASAIASTVHPRESMSDIYVSETGWGLPWVLRRLQGEDRNTFAEIEKQLAGWFSHITSVDFEEASMAGVSISFRSNRSAKLIPAALESDGVLHALFLLWRLCTIQTRTTICLEEPENGVHPYLLRSRYHAIQDYANRLYATKDSQILVATQSPDFLEAIDTKDAPDIVRIVEYGVESGTKIFNLKDLNDVDTLLETFRGNIGELWWSGAIGGVPPRVSS